MFSHWVPVSQYHACIASDELLPLYRATPTPSRPATVHVRSPAPAFKHLNHTVIATRTAGVEVEDLQKLRDGTNAVNRPGTCSAVLQTPNIAGTVVKPAAQGHEAEPSLKPLLRENFCVSIQEESASTNDAHHSAGRSPHVVGGVSKTTQVGCSTSTVVGKPKQGIT